MSPVPVARHDVSATRPATPAGAASATATRQTTATALPQRALPANATDDEILGLISPSRARAAAKAEASKGEALAATEDQRAFDFDTTSSDAPRNEEAEGRSEGRTADPGDADEPEKLRTVFDANPELRQAWHDANAYRAAFKTPADARAATAQLADLDRLDALFFSNRPEDHAQLARSIASLDPAAFSSFAQAVARLTPEAAHERSREVAQAPAEARPDSAAERNSREEQRQPRRENAERPERVASAQREGDGPTVAQAEFFQAANAQAVQSVLGAIESQVERLLPEGVSKSARNRMVGEIYRELDSALQSNRQFGQQMREAFRSGALDADHQRAVVSLITGRARQALPAVAKRVLSEWTSTVVAANQDRRARQRAAEARIDIAGSRGSGNEGRRSMAPRDIDYARMSDAEILNL